MHTFQPGRRCLSLLRIYLLTAALLLTAVTLLLAWLDFFWWPYFLILWALLFACLWIFYLPRLVSSTQYCIDTTRAQVSYGLLYQFSGSIYLSNIEQVSLSAHAIETLLGLCRVDAIAAGRCFHFYALEVEDGHDLQALLFEHILPRKEDACDG